MGYVRSNRNSHWTNPQVAKYHDYKSKLQTLMRMENFVMPDSGYWLKFYIPMSKSWSNKKKTAMLSKPHQFSPDKDNLEKGFLDAYFYRPKKAKTNTINGDKRKDCVVWDGRVSKYWSDEGSIVIEL